MQMEQTIQAHKQQTSRKSRGQGTSIADTNVDKADKAKRMQTK